MASDTTNLTILMSPWLAHGHIFPFLELANKILKYKNFHIYLCTTAINFSSINKFIHQNHLQNSLQVLELHLEPNPNLPPHYQTTKNLPSHLNLTLLKAFQTARSSFSDILAALKPNLVIFDFQPWAATLAASRGIPAVHFATVGAAHRSFVHNSYISLNDDFPFPELYLQDNEKRSLDNLMKFLYEDVFNGDKDVLFVNFRLSSEIVLLKTSKGLEGKYIDYLSSVTKKRILGVGSLVADADQAEDENSEILQWLSKKEPNSTVYISFGSENFLSNQEIEEMAKGLELCEGVNFLWIIRFPIMEKTMSIEEVLPQGFLDRVKDRVLVVSGWAPQVNILRHPSTGAFVSHCGWSSVNESVYNGVPVIGIPMGVDMFLNAKMLVNVGACVEVVREENCGFKGEEIAKAIEKVMGEERGEGMRERVKELSEKMRMEEEEAIEETAECLWQICCNNKD
ncbi:hypothetical protein ACS0TY_022631 [Phlomoides rotata]